MEAKRFVPDGYQITKVQRKTYAWQIRSPRFGFQCWKSYDPASVDADNTAFISAMIACVAHYEATNPGVEWPFRLPDLVF